MTTINMNEAPPVAPDEAPKLPDGESTTTVPQATPSGPPASGTKIGKFDLELFLRRVIADAMSEATATYWLRRADALEAAKNNPNRPVTMNEYVVSGSFKPVTKITLGVGDFPGRESAAAIAHRNAELDAAVLACRQKAGLIRGGFFND